MENFQRKIYSYIILFLPPIFLPVFLKCATYCRFVFYKNEDKQVLNKNSSLKNAGEGKDAYLLATGPSLKGVDLQFLENKDCFSVSNFILHEQINSVSPMFHFFAPYHKPLIYEEYVGWLKKADELLPSNTDIFLSLKTKKCVEENFIFEKRTVYYLSLEKASFSSVPDITKPVLSPQTSPLMILPVLHYMGYKAVYLLGCDHNILKNYGGIVDNFYSNKIEPRKNATSGGNWRDGIVSHLEFAKNVFCQYKYYKALFERTEKKLINTSESSWLDFLEYSSVNDLRIEKK